MGRSLAAGVGGWGGWVIRWTRAAPGTGSWCPSPWGEGPGAGDSCPGQARGAEVVGKHGFFKKKLFKRGPRSGAPQPPPGSPAPASSLPARISAFSPVRLGGHRRGPCLLGLDSQPSDPGRWCQGRKRPAGSSQAAVNVPATAGHLGEGSRSGRRPRQGLYPGVPGGTATPPGAQRAPGKTLPGRTPGAGLGFERVCARSPAPLARLPAHGERVQGRSTPLREEVPFEVLPGDIAGGGALSRVWGADCSVLSPWRPPWQPWRRLRPWGRAGNREGSWPGQASGGEGAAADGC